MRKIERKDYFRKETDSVPGSLIVDILDYAKGDIVVMRYTSIITNLSLLTFVLLLLRPFQCLAGVQGDVELFKTIALKHKTNFESILTWKGEAFEQRTSTKKMDNYDYMLKNKCTFAYDQLQQAVRWNMDPKENRFVIDGKPQRSLYANYNSIMIKDQSSYDYKGGGLDKDGKVTYQLVIAGPERLKGMGNHGLDPRYFFFNHGLPIHDKLMHLYNNANNPQLMKTYVKKDGDYVTVTTNATVNDQPIVEKWVFDLSAAGNLVEYYNKGPRAENIRKYEYEEKSGVWILKSYNRINVTHHEDGDLKSTRTITWSNSVVNEPFKEDEFTLEKLGVKHGTLVSDLRIGKTYIYEGVLLGAPLYPKALKGKRLPELKDLHINILPADVNDKVILLCFWDMNQRPSRNCIAQLAKQAARLEEKGVVIAAVQASKVDKDTLNEWVKKNNIPFPVGMITGDIEKIRFAWGVKSLPWLILTDRERVFSAEGFNVNELDEHIVKLGEKP